MTGFILELSPKKEKDTVNRKGVAFPNPNKLTAKNENITGT
jgi:hypothetical protein